jgi:hypothetical protein
MGGRIYCQDVGFNSFTLLENVLYAGIVFLDNLNKKEGVIAGLRDIAHDMLPEVAGIGVCPFCKQEHVQCCKCKEATPFRAANRNKVKTVRCEHCGQKMKLP